MRILTLLAALLLPVCLKAQTGGSAIFRFLDLPSSARHAALGGNFISIRDNDLNTS